MSRISVTPPDVISRYREDEEKDAECLMQAIVDDCTRRMTQARQNFSAVKSAVITDRMRLRRSCSAFDPEFAAVVLPRLEQGNFARVEEGE